eukprot:TRINITY_DN1049_c0_g1_i1.p1 TRINITY_DN1049_c0_g1~~TRINITY_DN1049_c0_g1_i1.p1  ORF type:complete len:412 (-),score=142.19 TRINITY_DN1049_c0_g1_i1:80-1315(-)
MESSPQYVVAVSANKPKVLSLVPSDPGSRYKCRQLQVQVHGHSKMIKTILVNILDVAKDFQVPPPYLGTFMGYEIGAMSKFDTKKPERQQASISGEHEIKDLSKLALKFIQEVVLCPVCGLPEVQLKPNKNQVMGECRACGGNSEMKINNDKFKRYVINHPPERSGDAFSNKTEEKTKQEKTRNSEKEPKDKKEKKEKKSSKDKVEEPEEDVVWYSDTSSAAVKARKGANVPESLPQTESAENGSAPVKVLDKDQLATNIANNDFAKIDQQKAEAGLSGEQLIRVIVEVIAADFENLAKKHKQLLSRYASNEATQCALLNAIEENVAKSYPTLIAKAPIIIKSLYDEEFLVEETILLWSTSKHANLSPQFRQAVQPLIKWLQEAEEESEEEEEEGDEADEEGDAAAMLAAL